MEYISLDFDGLSKTVAELIGGIEIPVDTNGFSNDLVTFRDKDDVLTLLVHLGYLAYDEQNELVYIPKKNSPLPALVIELKWKQSAEGAIAQIKNRDYPAALQAFGGEILLVGINYEKNVSDGQRKHTCVIEKWER